MKRLTRSNTNKVFSGVFGGLGEYFGIDAVILRIVYIIIAFNNIFLALVAYGIAAAIIPADDVIYQDSDNSYYSTAKDNSAIFVGVGLIALGLVFLVRIFMPSLHILFPNFRHIIRTIRDLWPVLLILLGVFIIVNQKKN